MSTTKLKEWSRGIYDFEFIMRTKHNEGSEIYEIISRTRAWCAGNFGRNIADRTAELLYLLCPSLLLDMGG